MPGVAIVGKSGTGKSTSYGNFPKLGIKGLNPKETVVINVCGKDLPFKGWQKLYKGTILEGGNYLQSSNATQISTAIKYISNNLPNIKNIVLDDGQFIMSFEFMNRAKEPGYGKFADIGVNMGKIIEASRITRTDLKVYFLWHPEQDKETGYKMKTIGAMVDAYLTLEGLFTVVLYSKISKEQDNTMKYEFVTNFDGEFPAKSPIDMFEKLYIPNDLGIVSETIDKYNEGK